MRSVSALGEMCDERRFVHDLPAPVPFRREPRQCPVARSRSSVRGGTRDLRAQRFVRNSPVQPFYVQPLVGTRQQWLIGDELHFLTVRGDARADRLPALGFGGTILSSCYPDAGHEATQVPLPGARMCLVEVVQVDDQVPFRRRVKSEVTQDEHHRKSQE